MVRLVVTNRAGQQVKVEASSGISLMENIRELDSSVDAICGGLCACATCHVHIDPAWANRLPQRQEEETLLISDSANYIAEQSRLSCQIQLTKDLDGLEFTIAPEEF
ncbi:MAG: 2Fe-2S iron-sulfur cluster-binding protein [Candidatus Rariloculaceae bacterium]|nr:ferredoxin [Gammaproteobacteria bacterium]|tara:strand:- start:1722 stop:2042 length:321 start_codon:yes stop_codon:yes gene_type:complete